MILAKRLVVDDGLEDSARVAGEFTIAFGEGDGGMHDGDACFTALVHQFNRLASMLLDCMTRRRHETHRRSW